MAVRLVILDRDGVLNLATEGSYVTNWNQFVWLPGAKEGLALMLRAGIRMVVTTNQAGIGKGLIAAAKVDHLHLRMLQESKNAVQKVYVCPHREEDDCACRKPRPGLLLQAISDGGHPDPSQCIVVGDTWRDAAAASAVGCRFFLVTSGIGNEADLYAKNLAPERVFANLLSVARYIVREDSG